MRKLFIILFISSIVYAQNPYRSYNSFNAGELSPYLSAREDLTKYQSGCSIMENFIPYPQGGVTKRPGTKYIAEVKTSSLSTRLIPFEYSTEQSFAIEAGNQYMRFFTDGAPVLTSGGTETNATYAAAGTVLSHWKMNDSAANTAVDDTAAAHDGVASGNTEDIDADGKVGTGCFDLDGTYAIAITDGDDADLLLLRERTGILV